MYIGKTSQLKKGQPLPAWLCVVSRPFNPIRVAFCRILRFALCGSFLRYGLACSESLLVLISYLWVILLNSIYLGLHVRNRLLLSCVLAGKLHLIVETKLSK